MKKPKSITQLKKQISHQVNTYILVLRTIHEEINGIQQISYVYPNDGNAFVRVNAPELYKNSKHLEYLLQSIEGYLRILKVSEPAIQTIQQFDIIQLETQVGIKFHKTPKFEQEKTAEPINF